MAVTGMRERLALRIMLLMGVAMIACYAVPGKAPYAGGCLIMQ